MEILLASKIWPDIKFSELGSFMAELGLVCFCLWLAFNPTQYPLIHFHHYLFTLNVVFSATSITTIAYFNSPFLMQMPFLLPKFLTHILTFQFLNIYWVHVKVC